MSVLLDCFLQGQCESYIVEMCNASFELREQFETPGCITKIVETYPRPEYMLKMLLCFAQVKEKYALNGIRKSGFDTFFTSFFKAESYEWEGRSVGAQIKKENFFSKKNV